MTLDEIARLLVAHAQDVESEDTVWEFKLHNVTMVCITDQRHDRMRLIAPVVPARSLTSGQVGDLLEANFHTALDARYATSDGMLFAAFIHPLRSLSEDLFISALQQVASLVVTFGATYSSGELSFGGRFTEPPNN